MLSEPAIAQTEDDEIAQYILYIPHEPVQITGRYYALVKFLVPVPKSDLFRVVHYSLASGRFDGIQETVRH